MRLCAVVGERNGERVDRISGQPDEEAERDERSAERPRKDQQEFDRCARRHHEGHDQAPVHPVRQPSDGIDAARRPDHDRRGKERNPGRFDAALQRIDRGQCEGGAVGRPCNERGGDRDGRKSQKPGKLEAHRPRLLGARARVVASGTIASANKAEPVLKATNPPGSMPLNISCPVAAATKLTI